MAFDEAYYQKFYGPGRACEHGPREIDRLARGVVGLLEWFGAPLESVLDVGAGPGHWRDWFRQHRPDVRFRSCDVSEYACERWGHERRDIARWRADEEYDLVVCQGVLAYLDEADCTPAVENLAAMTRGFLYLAVLTSDDVISANVDFTSADLDANQRPSQFYLQRLQPHFRWVGCGLFQSRRSPVRLLALESGR